MTINNRDSLQQALVTIVSDIKLREDVVKNGRVVKRGTNEEVLRIMVVNKLCALDNSLVLDETLFAEYVLLKAKEDCYKYKIDILIKKEDFSAAIELKIPSGNNPADFTSYEVATDIAACQQWVEKGFVNVASSVLITTRKDVYNKKSSGSMFERLYEGISGKCPLEGVYEKPKGCPGKPCIDFNGREVSMSWQVNSNNWHYNILTFGR